MNDNTNLIPYKLQENNFYLNMVAEDITNDYSIEAESYQKQIKNIVQRYYNGEIDTITALNKIHRVLVNYDYFVVVPREEGQRERKEIYIDNPFDITELAIKNNIHEHDVFVNGLFELFDAIGVENLGLTDSKGNLITDTMQLRGGNQRKKADQYAKQYLDYKRRPDLKRYAIEVTEIFDEPIITVFLGQGQAKNGFYTNRLLPMITEKFLEEKNEIITTTFNKLAEQIQLVNHNYNVYINLEYNSNMGYLLEQAQKHNELINAFQFRQFYKNAYKEIRKIVLNLLYKLNKSYKAISFKENYLITAKDKDNNLYSFTSTDWEKRIIERTEADVLQEMKIPTIETVFLKQKAPLFFKRVLECINAEYGENWVRFKSQIEITILSPSQLQKCYEEYIIKHSDMTVSIEECRERLKQRILHLVDYEINRTQNKYDKAYSIAQDKARKSIGQARDIQDLKECDVYSEADIDKFVERIAYLEMQKSNTYLHQTNYKDIQTDIMKFLIDSTQNLQ